MSVLSAILGFACFAAWAMVIATLLLMLFWGSKDR